MSRHVATISQAVRRSAVLPRTTIVTGAISLVVHLLALVWTRGSSSTSGLSWTALAAADLVMLASALVVPERFQLRRFQLPGVLAVTTHVFILTPLPWAIDRYDAFLPSRTVMSIAVGTALLWITLAFTPMTVARRSEPSQRRDRQRPTFVPLIALAALITLPVWLVAIPEIPVVRLLLGSSGTSAAELREAALRDLDPVPLRIAVSLLRNLYLGFAAAWFTADWFVHRREHPTRANRSLVALTFTFGLAAAFALVTTERAIVGQVILACAVAALVVTGRRLTAGLAATLALIGVAFPLLFGVLISEGSPAERLSTATEGVRRRVFYLPSDVLAHYFTAIPTEQDFLDGASIPKFGRIFGSESFDLPGFVNELYYRRGPVAGSANGSFLGVGWANHGLLGVVIWCVLAGVAVVVLESFLRRRPARTSAALRGIFVVQVALLTQADLFRSILSFAPGILDLVLIVWVSERVLSRRHVATRSFPSATVAPSVARP